MKKWRVSFFSKAALLSAAAALIAVIVPPYDSLTNAKESDNLNPSYVHLRIMETTDLHDHLVNYDYYKNMKTNEYGFSKTAALIRKSRKETENSMLFDDGDLIQGNPLADYMAKVKGLWGGYVHPVFRAMNKMHYDAATVGNHEFNYGLKYLKQALDTADFPYVSANIYLDDHDKNPNNDVHLFRPYLIIPKKVRTLEGKYETVHVGVTGFTTPLMMKWDRKMLTGTIKVKGVTETAREIVPEMKKAGADIIVALVHTGLDSPEREKGNPENAVYHLSGIKGIDVMLFGHLHRFFPGSPKYNHIPGIDNKTGKVNGIPAVEAGYYGNSLGIIDLNLKKYKGAWSVESSQSSIRKIYDYQNRKALVKSDRTVLKAADKDHKKAIEYSRNKIGRTKVPINSYFSRVEDSTALELVASAQKWYIKQFIQAFHPVYGKLPILSAVSPAKSGVHGPNDYTNIKKGELTLNSVHDLYPYNNTIKAVQVTGAQVKDWLEMSASQFNQIDLKSEDQQELFNPQFDPSDFDVIEGLKYDIDITEPPKFQANGTLLNKNASRIKHLQFKDGSPVLPDQRLIVVTNSYRTNGGGNYPVFTGSNASILINTSMETKKALAAYLKVQGKLNRSPDKNWRIQPLSGDVYVTFPSSLRAKNKLNKRSKIKFEKKEADETGVWGIYSLKTKHIKKKQPSTEKVPVQSQ